MFRQIQSGQQSIASSSEWTVIVFKIRLSSQRKSLADGLNIAYNFISVSRERTIIGDSYLAEN